MDKNDKNIRISKLLTLILRHRPEQFNLTLDGKGWLMVKDLIQEISKDKFYEDFDLAKLTSIVSNCDKQRFEFNDNKTMIRATQGHSIEHIEMEYECVIPTDVLYHGTISTSWLKIKNKGIDKMGRTMVHLSDNVDTATKVALRRGKPVILVVDAIKMAEDGINFFKSNNGVWLTNFVDAKYIKYVNYE